MKGGQKKDTGEKRYSGTAEYCCILSGSAEYQSEANMLAKEQVRNISMNLLVKSVSYTLISAQSSGALIKMVVISEGPGQHPPESGCFLTQFQY